MTDDVKTGAALLRRFPLVSCVHWHRRRALHPHRGLPVRRRDFVQELFRRSHTGLDPGCVVSHSDLHPGWRPSRRRRHRGGPDGDPAARLGHHLRRWSGGATGARHHHSRAAASCRVDGRRGSHVDGSLLKDRQGLSFLHLYFRISSAGCVGAPHLCLLLLGRVFFFAVCVWLLLLLSLSLSLPPPLRSSLLSSFSI